MMCLPNNYLSMIISNIFINEGFVYFFDGQGQQDLRPSSNSPAQKPRPLVGPPPHDWVGTQQFTIQVPEHRKCGGVAEPYFCGAHDGLRDQVDQEHIQQVQRVSLGLRGLRPHRRRTRAAQAQQHP